MKETILSLSNLRGISGFEYRISDRIAELFKPLADEVTVDNLGNIIAVKKCGQKNARKVMIEAHMDEIGLMVSEIDPRGFLRFVNVGGVDPRILPASEVTVHGKKDLPGIIGAKPPHLQAVGEADKSAKITDMAIDVGLSFEEVSALVSVGDSVTLSQSAGALGAHQWSGKTMEPFLGWSV